VALVPILKKNIRGAQWFVRGGDGRRYRYLLLAPGRRVGTRAELQRVSTGDFTKRMSRPGAFNPGMLDGQLGPGQRGAPIKVGEDTIGGTQSVAHLAGTRTKPVPSPVSTKSRSG
jgi:hypothetical protein